MNHLRKFNEIVDPGSVNFDEDHILIVWTESGDEIHFSVMDTSHLIKIEEILSRPTSRTGMLSQEDDNELVGYIIDNKLDDDFYQSGTTTDYKFGEYNIKKVLHLSQLGY